MIQMILNQIESDGDGHEHGMRFSLFYDAHHRHYFASIEMFLIFCVLERPHEQFSNRLFCHLKNPQKSVYDNNERFALDKKERGSRVI